jgi:hypothetical protein
LTIPLFMVLVFFYFTQRDQGIIDTRVDDPDVIIDVRGKQWSWDFNYVKQDKYSTGVQAGLTGEPGIPEELPTLLPARQPERRAPAPRPRRPALLLGAGLPAEARPLPGRVNYINLTPTQEGTFDGKCAELCGQYHSEMLFNVKVVSQEEFDAQMATLNEGQLGDDYDRDSYPDADPDFDPCQEQLMSTYEYTLEEAGTTAAPRVVPRTKGRIVVNWITSTDHKTIGYMYLISSFVFFCLAGVMALVIRAELFEPGMQILQTKEQYNQLFTMHGTIMLLMFATPLFAGFANVIMPLQIGAPTSPSPGLTHSPSGSSCSAADRASGSSPPRCRRLRLVRLHAAVNAIRLRSVGATCGSWLLGRLSARSWCRQLHHHDHLLRAPGMTMFRMPIFTWNTLITSLWCCCVPDLRGAAACWADRTWGARLRPENGGAHPAGSTCSGSSGTPRSTSSRLPFFGIITEIIPVFSRKPLFGYKGLVFATIAIAALSVTVWAHHMYVTGAVLLPFFAFTTMLIAVPTGVKFFNWIGTMWRGSITFETPMLWSLGFLVTFLFGGLTGIILASPPLDFHVSDTYFVVAPLPLRGLRHRRLCDVRRLLLLVAQVHREDAQRAPGQDPLLAPVPRLPRNLPHPALARSDRHAPPVRRLPSRGRVHRNEPVLNHRLLRPRRLADPVLLERLHHLAQRQEGRGRRPVGLRRFARVGNFLPAAPPQLHLAATDPF